LNNIITNSQNCGIFFDTSYDWGIPNNNFNDVWGNVGGNYCGLAAAGTNDVFATPLFLSPLSGDYHLLPTSPCIDAGTNEGAPKIDFDGDDRPIDGNADGIARVDIGADEAGLLLSHDIAVQLTLPQTVPIKFGTSFTPEARLMNFGSHNEDGFTVTCEIRLKSIPIYSETQTLLHLDSMSMVNVDFSNWTPQAIGNYQLTVYTQLSGDENPSNDTEKRTVKVLMEDPNVFGIDRGNTWKYQGKTYTLEKEVVSLDQTTFPTVTYIVEDRENGEKYRGWYEKTPGELKLWGTQEVATGEFIRFSAGLVEAWYPMQVGDQRYSYATAESNLYPGIIVNTSLTADVLAKEPAILDFDTFEAFKVRYQLRLWGYGIDETDTFYQWVVPYLGVVKYQDTEQLEKLTSFIIGGGTITEETDTDGDGLKDYQELIIYDTSLADSDTDNDSMPDGWEVFYGLDPKSNDSTEDFDGDGYSNLIEYLRGTAPNDPNSHPHRAMPWIPLLLLGE
jgi:hypothetical protein